MIVASGCMMWLSYDDVYVNVLSELFIFKIKYMLSTDIRIVMRIN